MKINWQITTVIGILLLPLLLYAQFHLQRPPRTNLETTLFPGITYQREAHRSGIRALNAPIHTKLPMRQRPVANHLGFFATINQIL